MDGKVYLCIDLKSFYASVECVERQLDPLTTNLVVADESRTEKTIVLAVSPALKTFGLPGRSSLKWCRRCGTSTTNARRPWRTSAPSWRRTTSSGTSTRSSCVWEIGVSARRGRKPTGTMPGFSRGLGSSSGLRE